MNLNQYAVYQLKAVPENRKLRFHPYKTIQAQNLQVRSDNYQQVYMGMAVPEDSPASIYKKLLDNPPKSFAGHRLSVSDVIVHNKGGVTSAYYIDKDGFVNIAGFFRSNSSGTLITMETRDYPIEGCKGSWVATDEIIIDGKQFFMMESEQYGRNAAAVIIDSDGKLVSDDCTDGFDDKAIQQIREYLHPPEKNISEKPPMENYQKYYENGEYLRSAEITEEQNYNMIDGRINNQKKKPVFTDPKKRPSVLKRLHQKQDELAKRYGKHEQENAMELNRK